MPEARCLCADHVWRVDAPLQLLHHCHCTYCRKHQGVAYTTMGAVAPEHFTRVSQGDTIAYPSSPGLTRRSCARCGSPVPGDAAAGLGLVFVFAGPLEGDPGDVPSGHIFAASKAPWFAIEDGLPTFDAYPPGHDAPIQQTPTSADPPGAGVRGSCLCGEVRFAITGEPIIARHCHCLRCRRARGALHASNLVVPLDAFRFTHGRDRVRSFKLPEARYFTQSFCSACGSTVPVVDAGREIAIVPLGSLDDDPGIRPSEHIWVDSKAAWHEIADDLPRHSQGPPA
jgi:hypothetical protein